MGTAEEEAEALHIK